MTVEEKKKLRLAGINFTKKFFTTKNIIVDKYKTKSKDSSYLTNLVLESKAKRCKSFFKSRSFTNSFLKSILLNEGGLFLEHKDFRRLTQIEHTSHYINFIQTETLKLVLIWDLNKEYEKSVKLLPLNTFKSDLQLVEKEVINFKLEDVSFAFTLEGGNYKVLAKKELKQTINQL